MIIILYVISFAFHSDVDFNRIIIECSFRHYLLKLTNIGHSNRDIIQYADSVATVKFDKNLIKRTNRKI